MGQWKQKFKTRLQSQDGVALLLVLTGLALMAIYTIEMTKTAQLNRKIAYDALAKVQSHYLAKSGYKLSLLRLKAYKTLKGFLGSESGSSASAAMGGIPQNMIEQIWSFPLIYPLPTEIPGISDSQKSAFEKFSKDSSLAGSFTATIESESSRFNINSIIEGFQTGPTGAPADSDPPGVPSTTGGSSSSGGSGPSGATGPAFDPEAARAGLRDTLFAVFDQKLQNDVEFSQRYRGFDFNALMDQLFAWMDRTYPAPPPSGNEQILPKGAPIYDISELLMLPLMDETLFGLFAPILTVQPTVGINVNTMARPMLRALVPGITDEEVEDFYEFRDDPTADNQFKDESGFFDYLGRSVTLFRGSAGAIESYREDLQKRGIKLVFQEEHFRIRVTARVRESETRLEAVIGFESERATQPGQPGPPPPAQSAGPDDLLPIEKSGLTTTFMRIL